VMQDRVPVSVSNRERVRPASSKFVQNDALVMVNAIAIMACVNARLHGVAWDATRKIA